MGTAETTSGSVTAGWARREREPGTPPRVLIVGGGMSGLSTGCYSRMSGARTLVLEKHVLPGGCCTAWSREGYVFDYTIEWLTGSGRNNDAARVWRELGALDGKTVTDFEFFNRIVDENGREVVFYNDPDRLEAHLLEVSPQDARPIRGFCRDLRGFVRLNHYPFLTPPVLRTPQERLRAAREILPGFRLMWRTATTSMEDFAARFQDPLLRRALPNVFFQDHEVFPVLPYLFNLASAHHRNAGFPQGGSLGLARSVAGRYTSLGGEIAYRARVTRVLVEGGRAVGVELRDGRRLFGEHVVCACDGVTVLKTLLGGEHTSPTLDALFERLLHRPEVVYPGVVSAFVGFEGDLPPGTPHSTTYLLPGHEAARLPSCSQNSLVVQLRSRYADGFAPPGRSVIHCTYFSDYGYWKELRTTDRRAYRARKAAVADFVRALLDDRYPGLGARIELVDVATPVTTERYTGNRHGSILGWKSFTEADDLLSRLVNKDRMGIPGLAGLTLAGQWFGGGGLILAASSGRFATQFLCRDLGLRFRAWESEGGEPWHPGKWGDLPRLDAWDERWAETR
ncbi:NAD(P)/FAD-dependent oxidoreductase [Nocardiopsis sp. EMB25]|uniref:phytoene desaturase family protein n=1 Tax=Nocardiopsis sp. EMB25 TaxID=2835867 RepID=UPI002283E834|nr:NAD(P)/FAD-dependent oxidoreductase [Nocardiopsis sp. EMB25]MCY9785317.1 NAD(P)/FAD-dependent oxidoreductase [Nocardiopsis sp. EMB25]